MKAVEENDNFQNQEISKRLSIDVSELKEEGKSPFCSDMDLPNNGLSNLNSKSGIKTIFGTNVYGANVYNVKRKISKPNSKTIEDTETKEMEDCYNDIKDSISSQKKEINISRSNISKASEKQNIESNIKILTFVWKSKMLFSGYYEFEILFTKRDITNNKILAQRTMYRSYNDIEILYEGLILYNPGCLIPKIPEKTFWENNKEIVEERKGQLENYLGYICKHEYLSKNPIFLIFLSDEFERYREKIKDNEDSYSIYNLIKYGINESYKYSKVFILNKLLSSSSDNNEKEKASNLNIEISDKKLRNEKLRLEKIATGTEKFISSLKEEITSVTEKIESMKNLHNISEILKDSNFRVELNQNNIDEKFLEQKNFFSMESIVYLKMAENYEKYIKKIKEIHKNLIKYKEVTEAMAEAFIRKEKVEFEFKKEKNADFFIGKNKMEKIREMDEQAKQIETQFFKELSNYHKNIENMFSIYANEYIEIKNKTDRENQMILMNKSIINTNKNNIT
jgi:hypothetical protein